MQRIVTDRDMNDGTIRYRVRIESDPCEQGSDLAERFRFMLLQNIVDNPALVACGYSPFQTLRMTHTGQCWVIEAEAIVARDTNATKESSNSPSS
jgi:hypothetical protein